uniref:Uncharacterized protein n=1 Tax=Arundo donax TaxID=35708 RepID=A0A0A8Z6L1_ARUDO
MAVLWSSHSAKELFLL